MPGTMTAPLPTVAATYRLYSIHWRDKSGDSWSQTIRVAAAATNANVEALLIDLQDRSNAYIWKTEDTQVREGSTGSANATTDPRSQSVFDHIITSYKVLATGLSQRIYIPAPIETCFDAPTDDDPSIADLADVASAALVVLGAGYGWKSARYTENSEINAAVEP